MILDLEKRDALLADGIRLEYRVEGGNTEGPGSNKTIDLTIQFISGEEITSEISLASDLAGLISDVYGPLGLDATAEGAQLHLSWEGASSEGAFAVLRFFSP